MLTCVSVGTNTAFQFILNFYKKPPAKVLDLTYGEGHSWEPLPATNKKYKQLNEALNKYDIVKADIRNVKKIDVRIDVRKPLPIPDKAFDVVYYDPPFYYLDIASTIDTESQAKKLLSAKEEIYWLTRDFELSRKNLKTEVPRVLKKDGFLIIKIGDAYTADEYTPNTFLLWESFHAVLKSVGFFIIPRQMKDTIPSVVRANSFQYLVFKKEIM